MSGNAKDLLIRLLVEDNELDKIDKAKDKLSKDFGGAALKGAATGSAIALGGLAIGAIAAGNAAADAEQSQQQLQFALDQFPNTADRSAGRLMALNSALAMKTQFDDDALASGQAVLAQFGITGAQIQELTPLLADYAAKTGQDVPTAAESLGKALLGQGRALKSVGIDFTDTGTLGGNYDAILSGLTEKVGGFAEAQGSTARGSAAIFQNSMGELMETLGQGLLPIMVQVTQAGVGLMTWMAENAEVVQILAIVVGIVASGILLFAGVMKVFAVAQAIQTAAQWASNAAWLASPITWIILAIILAIGLLVAAGIWLYQNWDSVVAWLGDLWAGFAKWWQNSIVAPISAGIDWLVKAIGVGLKWIGDAWNNTWSFLGDIVRNVWNGVLGWIEGGINGAIDLINGMIRGVNVVGGAFGLSISLIPHVRLPRLATGGVTTGPMVAMIGDNPGGREYVEPVDAVAARLERVAIAAAVNVRGNGGPQRLAREDLDYLAETLGSILHRAIVTGSKRTIRAAFG